MGRPLPTGTVTFLFTDVEGSTSLLREWGSQRYAEALADHRQVLREAFGQNGGVEVDTQGDAFFVAFPPAPGAVAAAREAQEVLEIPVRMGIHTGTPLLTDKGYVGADVHKAARVAAAGHGRQVLVSAATAALLDEEARRGARETGRIDIQTWALGGLARLALSEDRPLEAVPLIAESYELSTSIGDRWRLGGDSTRLARALAALDEPVAAVRVLAASKRLFDDMGGWAAWLRTDVEATLKVVHERLSDAEFEALWDEGSSLSIEEAFELGFRVLSGDA